MNRLWLVLVVLLVAVITAAGCGSPGTIKQLTEKDIDSMVEKALKHPDVAEWVEEGEPYQASANWGVSAWEGTELAGWYRMEYEDISDGTPPDDIKYVTQVVTINRDLTLIVGEPVRLFVDVIFDKDGKDIVFVNVFPAKSPPETDMPE
jgi:hypothetical protein